MRFTHVFTIAILLAGTLAPLAVGQTDGMGALPPETYRTDRSSRYVPKTYQDPFAGVDLYKKPDPLDESSRKIKATHPELFATEAVIVIFGADYCVWCKRQALELKGPSINYNVIYYELEKDGEPTKHAALYEALGLTGGESAIPKIVVMEKGKITKTFIGFTDWSDIKPHAEKAKKNESDKTDHIRIGPLNIDWTDGVDIDWRNQRNRRRH